MTDFRFTSEASVYGQLFLKFPVTLIRSEKYRKMSAKAKIAYMVLQDRLQYSIKNGWVDDENNVYFIFTNDDLEQLLNCTKPTVVKVKHELEAYDLLLQKQVGVNQPNRLYLAELDVTPADTYLLPEEPQTRVNAGSKISLLPKNAANGGSKETLLPPTPAITVPQTRVKTGSKISLPNLELELGSRYLSTRYLSETREPDYPQTKSAPAQASEQNPVPEQNPALERTLLAHFADSIDPTVSGKLVSRSSLQLIGQWSHSVKEARNRVGIILNAKRDIELEYDTYLLTEELQDQIDKALLRVVMRWKDLADGRQEGSIQNVDNYLYGAMKQVFENAALAELTHMAKTPEQKTALRALRDRFDDPVTGKLARREARERNRKLRAARQD